MYHTKFKVQFYNVLIVNIVNVIIINDDSGDLFFFTLLPVKRTFFIDFSINSIGRMALCSIKLIMLIILYT